MINLPTGFAQSSPLRYLALGDSYTIGEGVEQTESWPSQLVEELRSKKLDMTEPVVIARTGWTTENLRAALADKTFDQPFDLVTLLIGANDQFQRRNPVPYSLDLNALIQKAIGFAGGDPSKVIVVSIPDWGYSLAAKDLDKAAITEQIAIFNSMAAKLAAKNNVTYVDITGLSRTNTAAKMFTADGLHPSPPAYASWVKIILPHAHQILQFSTSK